MCATRPLDGKLGAVLDGRYRIDEILERSDRHLILGATDLVSGTSVVMKQPTWPDSDVMLGLRCEAAVAALATQFNWPHVVGSPVGGITESGAAVLDRVPGVGLDEIIRDGPLSAVAGVGIALQVCCGVEALHQAGLIHGDIKPGNVICDPIGASGAYDVTVIDLEGASVVNAALPAMTGQLESHAALLIPTLTSDSAVLGSTNYAAPETVHGEPRSFTADVYGVGATLYATLNGAAPYAATSLAEYAKRVGVCEVPPIQANITPQLQAVISKCLAPRPSDRFTSVATLQAALAEAC